jgi:flagellin
MSLRINTNTEALNAYRNLSVTQGQMSKSLEKLSSGYRINRAADDAAGLAISEGLKSQIGGIKVAVRNAQDGVSVVQTAEGALTETHSILQRMRDLAVQSANDSNDQTSRDAIDAESTALNAELDRISSKTTFNNVNLLDGTYSNKDFQVGYASGDTISVSINSAPGKGFSSTDLGVDTADLSTKAGSTAAIDKIDTAIKTVSTARANLGAVQNRFEHTINNLNVTQENLTSSQSRIVDVDMAQEMMSYTRTQVLSQAGTAMLAQANSSSQNVLSLLRG